MITKAWRAVAVLLVLVMTTMALASCSKSLTADELVQQTTRAIADLKDYRATMDGRIEIQAAADGTTMTSTLTADASGGFDLAKKAMQMDANVGTDSSSGGSQKFTMTIYSIDSKIYLKVGLPGQEPTWGKTNPSSTTDQQTSSLDIKRQLAILEGAQLKSLPEQNIEGTMSYGIEVTPRPDKMWQAIMSQPGMPGPDDETVAILQQSVKSSSVKLWLSKKDYYPTKLEFEANAVFDDTNPEQPDQSATTTVNATLSTRFYNMNKGIKIELPEEAKNAPEGGS